MAYLGTRSRRPAAKFKLAALLFLLCVCCISQQRDVTDWQLHQGKQVRTESVSWAQRTLSWEDRRADRCKKYAWQSTWEIVWFFHSFFRSATLSASLQANHPRSFLNPVLWVFREVSSHSHDGSLVIDSTSSSFPLPRGQVVVPKVPIHYLWSFRLASSHYPVFIWELCQNLHKLRSGWNIKTLFPFLSPRKFQELWVLCLKQV